MPFEGDAHGIFRVGRRPGAIWICGRPELMALGHEVLAIDSDVTLVNRIAPQVTHAVELDARDEDALRSLGAGEFEHAIVAISSHTETSIFATMALKRLGVRNVVAKAAKGAPRSDPRSGRRRPGRLPRARDGPAGEPRLGVPHAIDYLDIAPQFGIVKVLGPPPYVGRSLGEIDLAGFQADPDRAPARRPCDRHPPLAGDRARRGDELILLGPRRPAHRARVIGPVSR